MLLLDISLLIVIKKKEKNTTTAKPSGKKLHDLFYMRKWGMIFSPRFAYSDEPCVFHWPMLSRIWTREVFLASLSQNQGMMSIFLKAQAWLVALLEDTEQQCLWLNCVRYKRKKKNNKKKVKELSGQIEAHEINSL